MFHGIGLRNRTNDARRTLVHKEFPRGYDAFLHRNGIQHAIFDMKGTKKESIPVATMESILRVVLDRRNHPLLIHCNHGKVSLDVPAMLRPGN